MSQVVYQGNSLDLLAHLPDASVDAVVTDPPYGLGFMGKDWDKALPDPRTWSECLRVLKPGGHLVAFGAPRIYHRLACQIEDAGFELRDCLLWLFGSGFPKSLDVSKAIASGTGRPEDIRRMQMGEDYAPSGRGRANYDHGAASAMNGATGPAPASPWSGWGTALKPAYEPIALARKPLDGTVAANVLKWGTGAINVDGCRIGTEGGGTHCTNRDESGKCRGHKNAGQSTSGETFHGPDTDGGRWPANIILDEEAGAALDEQTAGLSGRGNKSPSKRGEYNATSYGVGAGGDCGGALNYGDAGGASRFFYCPKASRSEREAGLGHLPARVVDPTREGDAAGRDSPRTGAGRSGDGRRNHHPTVKPVELMRWLVRLVCPPGGVVLEPFAGSGSTLVAAALEDRDAIGMELDPEFVAIAAARVARAQKLAFAEETRMEQTSMDLTQEQIEAEGSEP